MTEPDTTHECPAPWCSTRVPQNMFACRADWYQLSKRVRARIWRGYRDDPGGDAHRAAMAAAIEEYRQVQQERKPTP